MMIQCIAKEKSWEVFFVYLLVCFNQCFGLTLFSKWIYDVCLVNQQNKYGIICLNYKIHLLC